MTLLTPMTRIYYMYIKYVVTLVYIGCFLSGVYRAI